MFFAKAMDAMIFSINLSDENAFFYFTSKMCTSEYDASFKNIFSFKPLTKINLNTQKEKTCPSAASLLEFSFTRKAYGQTKAHTLAEEKLKIK